ncbi:MAG: ECF transporter S component [Acholeplasmataceae bacterium]|nr:ECF transporter S component [Acholeplasmataceae bacterium]
MKQKQIQDLTLTSVFAAIIVVMIVIPFVGTIPIGLLSATLLHIPVLIGVFVLPKKYSLSLGVFFGVATLLKALIRPETILDPVFVYPWISVLPRFLFVLATIYLLEFFKTLDGKVKHSDTIIFGVVTTITVFGFYYVSDVLINVAGWNPSIIIPIALVLIALFVTTYFAFVNMRQTKNILIPSVMILGTLIHTTLVLGGLVLFEPALIKEVLQTEALMTAIYTIAATNGLLEAILAALIGTPIILTLNQLRNKQ